MLLFIGKTEKRIMKKSNICGKITAFFTTFAVMLSVVATPLGEIAGIDNKLSAGAETVYKSTVLERIEELETMFPTDSYFTVTGNACSPGHYNDESTYYCGNCKLSAVLSGNPKAMNTRVVDICSSASGNSWTCMGFAKFAFMYIWGHEWRENYTTFTSSEYGGVNDSFASLLRPGDYIWGENGYGGHAMVVKSVDTENDTITVMESNMGCDYYTRNKVTQGRTFSYSYYGYISVRQSESYDPHAHSFSSWQTTKVATCTESGTKIRICSCGEKETKTIPATGHTFGEIYYEATHPHYYAHKCTTCGYSERTGGNESVCDECVTCCEAVIGFKMSANTASTVTLAWNRLDGITGYGVWIMKDGKWESVETTTADSVTVSGLSAGTSYSFLIRAGKTVDGVNKWCQSYTITRGTTLPSDVSGLKIGSRAADALRLNWTKNTSADGYIIERYYADKWVRIAKITNNATTTYRVENLLAGKDYRFRIRAYIMDGAKAYYSNYSDAIEAGTNPSKVADFKLGGRAADALRLNWTKNTSADGYIIEKYDGAKWVRVTKITDNETVTYRVENLSASTLYKFRIRSYRMDGTTACYSGYSDIVEARTNPTKVAGFRIGGIATDAIRLNWNKNTTADGYIIEMYKDGKWTRITKLMSNTTLTYRVENLAHATTYKFRIRSYKMDGTTPYYSHYSDTLSVATY